MRRVRRVVVDNPCPFPGCSERTQKFLCGTHWPLVPGDIRRALVAEINLMKARGQRRTTARALELFGLAIREAQRKLDAVA